MEASVQLTEAMNRLDLRMNRVGSVPCLSLDGGLGGGDVDRFERTLMAVEKGDHPIILLDLRGLMFIDAAGISGLLDADARARQLGRHVLLTRPPRDVMGLLRMTLLDLRFEWVDTVPAVDPEPPVARSAPVKGGPVLVAPATA